MNEVDEDTLRQKINALIGDKRLTQLRREACTKAGLALAAAATYLAVPAAIGESTDVKGLALVVDMGAEMLQGTIRLYEAELWYAGTALIRQLVEVEYLLTVFSQEPAAAGAWLAASPKELRQWWNPTAMRERSRGRFLDREYWDHCERGGHPVPSAKPLLRTTVNTLDRRFCWIDFAVHARRLFLAAADCFRAFGMGDRLAEEAYTEATQALRYWSEDDPAPALLAKVPRIV